MTKHVLLALGLCTDPKKCGGRCWYCLVAKYGEMYWLRPKGGQR